MNGILKAIHLKMEQVQPNDYEGVCTVVNSLIPRTWGWAAARVYYMGSYQGLRLRFHDGKERSHYLPGRTSVYVINSPGIQNSALSVLIVDSTGSESKKQVHAG